MKIDDNQREMYSHSLKEHFEDLHKRVMQYIDSGEDPVSFEMRTNLFSTVDDDGEVQSGWATSFHPKINMN